ncbi:MAG: radical SAM family heme chaperone HemW [Thermodesulfobacteriota bacterium]|nr:radical SAM family heme chaperone HemW [Thermodesulfobacteriota bacterium]
MALHPSLASAVETARMAEYMAGLYIHIPFCQKKCPYCDFYSITDLSRRESYIQALMSEMELTRETAHSFDTIYLGGGTPSILSGREVEKILMTARTVYRIHPRAEITMEINPGTVNAEALDAYRQAGVNRISMGIQSFDKQVLKKLGRIHTAEAAIRSLQEVFASGFTNVGIDLMYGIPDQRRSDWRADLAQAVGFELDHISCYMLSFEPGTLFETERLAGRIDSLPDTVIADMFQLTVAELALGGYNQYEISNFARPGRQSRHNVKYWNGSPYLGLGAGAHSFDGFTRSWHFRNIDRYIQVLADGCLPVSGKERLTRSQHMLESIYLGLRTTAGIRQRDFERHFGIDFEELCGDLIVDLRGQGFVQSGPDRIALTVAGMLFLDSIVGRVADQIGEI